MDGGLLDQLNPDARRALLSKMVRRTFRKADTLFHEGDPGDTLHVIEKGHVAIRTSTRGGDIATLNVLGPGSSFGEQALLSAEAIRTASAVALDLVETRSLHRNEFEHLRVTTPAVERFLVQILAAHVRRLSAQLLDALYVPADQRVVRRLADVADVYSQNESNIDIPITQDDLASMAGTTRPTANRVLKQLETTGTVRLGRGQIVVVDIESLRKRAR
jgi:CRP/FNR family cyclic AMP-dependent transcriptional regulator